MLALPVIIVLTIAGGVAASQGDTLKFFADGHKLVFEKSGLSVVGGPHVLKVGFSGTSGVMPEAVASFSGRLSTDTDPAVPETASPLQEIRYLELWDGITLSYSGVDGAIWESTYYIGPHANAENIRLIYNVPVTVADNGRLLLQFKNGYMTESAPIAWQEVDGQKISVPVSFCKIADNEIGFKTGDYDPALPLFIDPLLNWHSFLGSAGNDGGAAVVVDRDGNVYVAGTSSAGWGDTATVIAHSGGNDVFVARLDAAGTLQWNTFLGSASDDTSAGIAVDESANVYVTGISSDTWGDSPVAAYVGTTDAFAAKLNAYGELQWNTFLGSASDDSGADIVVDGSGNVYVTGTSSAGWGDTAIVTDHSGGSGTDAFVARLGAADGALQWSTFMGATDSADNGAGIGVDGAGFVYATGTSSAIWGDAPSFPGVTDAFVAKLDAEGTPQWNIFLGSTEGDDSGTDIVVGNDGYLYITGFSSETWGNPDPTETKTPLLNPYSGGERDVLLAKIRCSSGQRMWHTFMGSSGIDKGLGIALDSNGDIYVTGVTDEGDWSWSTLDPYTGGQDAFAMKFNAEGALQWLAFMGSSSDDEGAGIAVDPIDPDDVAYVTGTSYSNWGLAPVDDYSGSADAFVVRLSPTVLPTVTTGAVSQISSENATVEGEVTDEGDTAVIARGHCWNTSTGPTISNYHTTDAVAGTGTFSSYLPALSSSTTYYCRAYAVNGAGIAYGEEVSFQTLRSGSSAGVLGREGHDSCFIESLLFDEMDRH